MPLFEKPPTPNSLEQLKKEEKKYEGLNEEEREKLKEEIEKEAQKLAKLYISALEKLKRAENEGKKAELTKEERKAFFGGATGSRTIAVELGFGLKLKDEKEEDYKKRLEEKEKELWEILFGPSVIVGKGPFEHHLEEKKNKIREYFIKKKVEEILKEKGISVE